jgi:hypothetical protein
MFVPLVVARERYEICKSCDEFNNIIKTCNKCGCFMPFKATIARVRCPVSKWLEFDGVPSATTEYNIED